MLRSGASLAEIGEVLRHENPNKTTSIYAKVDFAALRHLHCPGWEVSSENTAKYSRRLSADAAQSRFKLAKEGVRLPKFLAFMQERKARFITTTLRSIGLCSPQAPADPSIS